jgi:plasmid stabilization system protein ParE
MKLEWTAKAQHDAVRLYEFLAPANALAAQRAMQALVGGAERLLDHPRIGEKLERYVPREVRRILIGDYEMRYEIAAGTIYILRLWHSREDR